MDTQPGATTSGIGRRGLLTTGAGAAIAVAALALPESVEAAAAAKSGWRYCPKCRGLFAGKGTESVGVCPAGGSHKPLAGYNYLLLSGLSVSDAEIEKRLFQCEKCRGLFSVGGTNTGVCPKGGAHKQIGPEYVFWAGTALPFMEEGWDQCVKCRGVYWAGGVDSNGTCPAGGTHQRFGLDFKIILLK